MIATNIASTEQLLQCTHPQKSYTLPVLLNITSQTYFYSKTNQMHRPLNIILFFK